MKRIPPTQGLTLFFLIGLVILTLFLHGHIPRWHALLFRYVVLLGILLVLKWLWDRKAMKRIETFLYHLSPILFVIFIYESLGDLIQYLQPDIDAQLIRIDFFLFGVQPTFWMQRWIVPWLTDILSLAYISYYFIPVVFIVVLYLRNRVADLDRSVFVLVFGYYVSFIGYILFPAVGPRYALAHLYSVPLEGSFVSDFVRNTLNTLEHNQRDCMPSGHTQMVLMVLYLAHRYERFLFYLLFPIVCALIFSTIYLRYHYVIDLLVGGAFAIGCTILGSRLYRWWNQESG
ncbi:MAG TPA: phosphatase PAP2 family protein [Thermodesulfobacteriota bacterium]|nr:phosphatase PAP2 family protein [Thermodesulfobacteriota bacterium]